jgi:sulfur-carrier protein
LEGGLSSAGNTSAATVRVALPYHLRNLAHVEGDVLVDIAAAPVTIRAVLDALEARYPMLRGTIREYETGQRRAFLRFFVCEEDWSLESPDKALPDAVAAGKEPLLILGAIAGG